MALIRLTPDTAGDVVHQLVKDFGELVDSAGSSAAILKLAEHAQALERMVDSGVLEVEVIVGEVGNEWLAPVAHWLQLDPSVLEEARTGQQPIDLPCDYSKAFSVVKVRSGHTPPGRRAGERTPPILIVVHTPEKGPAEDLKNAIFDAVRTCPLSLLLVPKDAGWAKALSGLASKEAWMCKTLDLEMLADRDLQQNLERSPWKETAPLLLGWSVEGALESMYEALSLALDKELRSVKSKRIVLDQKVAAAQQRTAGNPSEIMSEVRSHLQKSFDTYQKGVKERMQGLVAQFSGSLALEIEAAIKSFEEFETEKKPKLLLLRVPSSLQQSLLSRMREVLDAAARMDLIEMGEMFRSAQEGLERLIEAKGGPPVVVHFHYLPEHEVTNLLDRTLTLQRPYKGQMARRGPMDYFMAARRYQMIFFMMFSAFGLSFIRSYRQFMVPATVLLLSFGLLNVINSARKQERETWDLELEKAREALRADLRRALNEIDKNWAGTISEHLAAQQASVFERIETGVTSFFRGASRKAAEDKALQQRQLKGLDQSDRKIADIRKKVQAAPQDLEQVKTQIRQLYATMVRPGEGAPRPGAPGAPGLPGAPRPGVPGTARPPAAAGASAPRAAAAVPAAAAEALKKLQELQKKKEASPARAAGGPAFDLDRLRAEAKQKAEARRKQSSGAAAPAQDASKLASGAATSPSAPRASAAPARASAGAGSPAARTPASPRPAAVPASPTAEPEPKQEAPATQKEAEPTPEPKAPAETAPKAAADERAAKLRERLASAPKAAAAPPSESPKSQPPAPAADKARPEPPDALKRLQSLKEKMAQAKAEKPQPASARPQASAPEAVPQADRARAMKQRLEELRRKVASDSEPEGKDDKPAS